jgi:hypothetical protein
LAVVAEASVAPASRLSGTQVVDAPLVVRRSADVVAQVCFLFRPFHRSPVLISKSSGACPRAAATAAARLASADPHGQQRLNPGAPFDICSLATL